VAGEGGPLRPAASKWCRRREEGPAAAVHEIRAEARPASRAAAGRGGREGGGARRTEWVAAPVALAGATQVLYFHMRYTFSHLQNIDEVVVLLCPILLYIHANN
jgi:hypothetical protein